MSAFTDTLAVDLLVRRPALRIYAALAKIWRYLVVAGPFAAALMLLKLIGTAGLASTISMPLIHQGTIVRIVLTTNPYVLDHARGLPLWIFLSIGISRGMLGDPLNYYFARRSAGFVKREAHGWLGRKLGRLVRWLEGSRHGVILAVVLATTAGGYLLSGIPMPLNPYWVAGTARVEIRKVLVVDLLGRLLGLLYLYHFGSPLGAAFRAAS